MVDPAQRQKCDNGARGKRCDMDKARTGELREKRINTPDDELRHDVTDELAAYKLAQLPFPGVFGVFYQSDRPRHGSKRLLHICRSHQHADLWLPRL